MRNIKILFACIPTPGTRYMIDLKESLEQKGCVVTWDYEEFWTCENNYDIIHIHWPEYLSFEIQSYLSNENKLPKELWSKIKNTYEYWNRSSSIVYTRHNQLPHKRSDLDFQNLYKLNAKYSNAVIHFTKFSIKQFSDYYPEISGVKHVVIPHQNYCSYPCSLSKFEARKVLNINQESIVMLVFGSVKESEKKLISQAFSYIPDKKKVLLAPGWMVNRRNITYIRLREWVYKFECWIAKKSRKKRINLGFIKENDVQQYTMAADFLFIPRASELTSGTLILGFSFGKIVVGKNFSNIGELLKESGNPVFEVGNNDSIKKSVIAALDLQENNLGAENRETALQDWNLSLIANKHIELFDSLSNK